MDTASAPRKTYDPIRRKWVAQTPEEAVRQAVVSYLLEAVKVPPRLVGVEYSLASLEPGNRRRADILVWRPGADGAALRPWLLVECKAPDVAITDAVAFQVAHYLRLARAEYLMVSNGFDTRYLRLAGEAYALVPALPLFPAGGPA